MADKPKKIKIIVQWDTQNKAVELTGDYLNRLLKINEDPMLAVIIAIKGALDLRKYGPAPKIYSEDTGKHDIFRWKSK